MKQKSNWLKELGMSLFLLGVFALIRFILISQSQTLRFNDETVGVILLAAAVVTVVLIYLTGKLRHVFSFSHDALVISIVGYFLWDLNGVAGYLVIMSLAVFFLLTAASAVSTIKLFRTDNPSIKETKELLDLHDFINRCLGPKFVLVALGAILIEKFLVPIIAG